MLRDEPTDPAPRAAAIEDDGTGAADALLAAVVAGQRASGRRVRGLLMTRPDRHLGCAAAMVLVDIDTADEYLVSQALGAGSDACRADPQGFARASRVLRRAMGEAPDLVVCNRFGGLEVTGGGFRDELLALMADDVPLLTVVASRHRAAWIDFTGGVAAVLPARAEAVSAWLAGRLPEPGTVPVA